MPLCGALLVPWSGLVAAIPSYLIPKPFAKGSATHPASRRPSLSGNPYLKTRPFLKLTLVRAVGFFALALVAAPR